MLREMAQSEWLEWMEWLAVRGPIGGPRTDFYTSFLAMHAAQPQKEVQITAFKMPWIREEDLQL